MEHEDIDEYLRFLLSRFGEIRHISVSSFPEDQTIANTRFAHVEFVKKSSLKLALIATERDYSEAAKELSNEFGSKYYNQLQEPKSVAEIKRMFPFIDENADELKEEVDDFMKDFEENELIAKIDREKKLNEVDEDGFMPVKHRSKRKRVVEERRGNGSKRERKEKKEVELKNFYPHQIREEKTLKLETLRKKFSEDKERVAKMKESKKFKPF